MMTLHVNWTESPFEMALLWELKLMVTFGMGDYKKVFN